MLARCHQLQSIFRLLKPFLHVQIWCQSVAVFQNHGVLNLLLVANWSTYKRVRYGEAVWWLSPLLLSYSIWLEIDAFITAWHKHFEDLSDRINMEIIMRGWVAVGGKVIVNLLHMCPYWMTVLFQLPRGYKVCDKPITRRPSYIGPTRYYRQRGRGELSHAFDTAHQC